MQRGFIEQQPLRPLLAELARPAGLAAPYTAGRQRRLGRRDRRARRAGACGLAQPLHGRAVPDQRHAAVAGRLQLCADHAVQY
ncbi:MAG: hypothetical protein U0Z44_06345 [Kouleothrix sp.]